MIVQSGISEIIGEISTLISSAVVSSATDVPNFTNTSISGEVASVDVSDVVISNNTLTFQGVINSVTGNGADITKIGVFTTNSILFSDDNHPLLEKTETDELRYFYRLILKRGGT